MERTQQSQRSERSEHSSDRRVQAAAPSTGAHSAPTNRHQGETTYTGVMHTSRDPRFLAVRSKRAMQFIATYASKDIPHSTAE